MQTSNIQMAPGGVRPVVNVSQFDVGRQFSLKLYDGATAYVPPAGTSIRIDGIKPDGHGFSYTDVVSLSDSTVTITTTTQMTIVEGTVSCELRLSLGDDDIGTVNFDMIVEKSPINEDTDLSETEIPAIVALATIQMENAEAWAIGTKDGVPVPSTEPQYNNSAKYWAESVGGLTQDAEAWAVGTKNGTPVTSSDPQYHNNSKWYAEDAGDSATAASTSASSASTNALKAEGYAVGTQNGTAVQSGSPYYHNNAEYYAGEASSSATSAGNAADRAEAAVVQEPYIGNNGNWFVYDFTTQQYVDTNVDATGPAGQTGPTGNGIVSITKTGTSGLVDTYTILFTNGQSTTFTVTNGQDGQGSGDMTKAVYDSTNAVADAGGIVAYVASQAGAGSLSGLSDVSLSSLATGQSLVYNSTSSKWENAQIAYSNISGTPTLGTAAAKGSTNAVTQNSTDLVESGAVYTETQKAYQTGDSAETAIDDADYVPFYDTSASGKRKSLWSNIKSVLKTYFDTLYKGISVHDAWSEVTSKPFSTVGSGLTVTSDTIAADIKTVVVGTTGTASASAVRYQRIGVNGSYTEIKGTKYMETTTYTTSGDNRVFTFTNVSQDAVIDGPYCDKIGVAPTAQTHSGTTYTASFATSDAVGKVRIYLK